MLYGTEHAVCSKVNIKQINTVWTECIILKYKNVGIRNQCALKCEVTYSGKTFA